MSLMKKPAQLQKLVYDQAEKLMDREIEFQALFDQAPVGIAKVDSITGNFIKANNQYAKLLDTTVEEMKQHNFQYYTYPDDLPKDLECMKRLNEGEISNFSIEKRYVNKSGGVIWVNLLVAALWKKGENPENHIAIVEDITQKKKDEQDLKKSFELVSDQNKRLLNFSYIVSHNLRSHTSNIQTISTFLETAETKEERDEMIDLLKKVSQSLNETMSNLNEVVNIRTNINLTVEKLHLKENIDRTITILHEQIVKKNAQINVIVPDYVMVNYNSAYLESILYNFISNAIRYSHPDRTPEITISFIERENILTISDNGIGIDLKKNGEKLFGMYKTFNNNPNSKGIGLFITKNQIDAMGGWIKVESEINIGTKFSIFFK
jgi:PAS domain S-box-containing protein